MTRKKVDNRINIKIIYDINSNFIIKEETSLYFKKLDDAKNYCENHKFELGLNEKFGLYRSGELIETIGLGWCY